MNLLYNLHFTATKLPERARLGSYGAPVLLRHHPKRRAKAKAKKLKLKNLMMIY
jgi:hypothetical protein